MKKPQQISTPECSTVELEEALKVLEGRWKILILFHLFSAPVLRFSELRRVIPGISQKMLIQQLRDLEKHGVVNRKVYPEVPPKVEYKLTKTMPVSS
jgi:DNA-binding HxlR family transcriptional regulator